MTDTAQVTYFAISLFSSRTFWLNAATLLVAVLSATEVIVIIPIRFLPLTTAGVAALNIWLRMATVRPVALIAPGTTAPVVVVKLPAAPSSPAILGD